LKRSHTELRLGAPGTLFFASRDFLQGLSRDNFYRGTRDFQGQKNIVYIYIMRVFFLKLNLKIATKCRGKEKKLQSVE